MDLVNDNQLNEINVRALARLPRDDVPLLRCRYNDLCLFDLSLCQVNVARQLLDCDPVIFQSLLETTNHLRDQSLHRCDVNDFKALSVESSILPAFLAQNLED